MADAIRKIEVNPDEWDADAIECPFADESSSCGLSHLLSGGGVQCCEFDGYEGGHHTFCPLKNGPIEISLKNSENITSTNKRDQPVQG